jgi:bifunctional UDP-N-acetylglucosamine pyrophosphorylase / glucosamine-1-phosphate N-acetyltransferase
MGLSIVILAAGKGKRMTSDMPKVMHVLGGLSLLEHVVNTAQSLQPDNIYIVYGNGGKTLPDKFAYLPVKWVRQDEQLGTGHAVLQALPNIPDNHQVLVLYGDVPLISTKTLTQLLNETPHNGLGLVVTELTDPTGFGRIIRNEVGNIMAIIEHKDANFYQRKIREINTGILTAPAVNLKSWLPRLRNENKQNEYYLTDTVSIAVDAGIPVGGVMAHRTEEVQGVNDRWQLANLERYYQREQAHRLTLSGTTIKDPNRFDVRGDLTVGADVTFDINVILEGKVTIGDNCLYWAKCYFKRHDASG